ALHLLDLRVETRGVELGEHLAGGHLVVEIDVDLADRAGELAADVDLVGRLKRSGRGDRDEQPAARDLLRAIRIPFWLMSEVGDRKRDREHYGGHAPFEPGRNALGLQVVRTLERLRGVFGSRRIHDPLALQSLAAVAVAAFANTDQPPPKPL